MGGCGEHLQLSQLYATDLIQGVDRATGNLREVREPKKTMDDKSCIHSWLMAELCRDVEPQEVQQKWKAWETGKCTALLKTSLSPHTAEAVEVEDLLARGVLA